jgi:rubrerythrin
MLSAPDQYALNDMMVLHGRALAVYLTYASPWDGTSNQEGVDIIREIADSHLAYSDEVGEMLLSSDVEVFYGEFPMPYTGYHDLSVDFMLDKMVASEKATIDRLLTCIERAENDVVRAIAERSLGASQAHLQELEEFIATAT